MNTRPRHKEPPGNSENVQVVQPKTAAVFLDERTGTRYYFEVLNKEQPNPPDAGLLC